MKPVRVMFEWKPHWLLERRGQTVEEARTDLPATAFRNRDRGYEEDTRMSTCARIICHQSQFFARFCCQGLVTEAPCQHIEARFPFCLN